MLPPAVFIMYLTWHAYLGSSQIALSLPACVPSNGGTGNFFAAANVGPFVLDASLVILMQMVEVNIVILRGRVHSDRHSDESE